MTDLALLGGQPAFPEGLPFFRPATPPLERVTARLAPSYERGVLTNGPLVRELETAVAERLGVPEVVAVASCTAGLMLAFQALARPGTAAVMPSFTFSATAHAARWAGAVPRFAECDAASCQLDLADAAARLEGASVLVGTHVFGAPCAPEQVEKVGRAAGLAVVFDAAHGLGATRAGRPVGSFGDAEVFSLSPTKPMTSGEGGLVAVRDPELARRIRLGVDYGNPGDYDTLFAGLNARMSELHAATALESLAELDDHLATRRRLAARYQEALAGVPGIRPQAVDPGDTSTYKDFTVIVDEDAYGLDRDALATALKAEGVDTRPYFHPPVHRQRAYADLGTPALPVTDWVAARVISLPLWRDMPPEAVDRVVELLARIHERADAVRAAAGATAGVRP
ncbi:MAG TPA: DegT/DnrJ/EryC1/StrS family aminotransferase [Acidimicrobiales bacterium]|nr:DegT/DnrJ/EryC1/StrS family aminotransferase [Acidimicrobiales bacterium]